MNGFVAVCLVLATLAVLIPRTEQQRRRQIGVPGGWHEADENGEGVQEAAKLAVEEMPNKVNSPYGRRLQSVEKAKTQVVSGTKYNFTLFVEHTSCLANSGRDALYDRSRCPSVKAERCDVIFWHQPWTGRKEITKLNCA